MCKVECGPLCSFYEFEQTIDFGFCFLDILEDKDTSFRVLHQECNHEDVKEYPEFKI